jgi:hypothetical protein
LCAEEFDRKLGKAKTSGETGTETDRSSKTRRQDSSRPKTKAALHLLRERDN